MVLTGGKVTWPDETFATREVDRTREWIRANNRLQDELHILVESIASGLNRAGEAYSATVTSTLVYKRACRLERVRIPVSGIKTVVKGDRTMVVDFGDGTCDNIITVTTGDITTTIDLSSHNQ